MQEAEKLMECHPNPNGWSKDAVFLAKGFQDDLKLKAEFDSASGGKAPSAKKYYDLSYYQKALKLVNSKKP